MTGLMFQEQAPMSHNHGQWATLSRQPSRSLKISFRHNWAIMSHKTLKSARHVVLTTRRANARCWNGNRSSPITPMTSTGIVILLAAILFKEPAGPKSIITPDAHSIRRWIAPCSWRYPKTSVSFLPLWKRETFLSSDHSLTLLFIWLCTFTLN